MAAGLRETRRDTAGDRAATRSPETMNGRGRARPTTRPCSPTRPGERLREAREAQGLIARRDRGAHAHAAAPSRGDRDVDYAALPSLTYAVGFAKAYARAVGADEVAIARDVRGELDRARAARRPNTNPIEIDRSGARAVARHRGDRRWSSRSLVLIAVGALVRHQPVPRRATPRAASADDVAEPQAARRQPRRRRAGARPAGRSR